MALRLQPRAPSVPSRDTRSPPLRVLPPSHVTRVPIATSSIRKPSFSRRSHQVRAAASPSPAASPAPGAPKTVPSKEVLDTWQRADAICFDVDCTITTRDSLDLLAEFMGVADKVEALTNQAMNGEISLQTALEERLKVLSCKPDDIKRFIREHPPETRLTKNIERLIRALQARNKAIYLISGGFRELTLPIARHLGIPRENVFANRMNWQWDDESGAPTRLVGFDLNEPTAHNQGKPQAIARIRQKNPYNTVVMIGDGITDLEAVQISGGADLFIGYGGVVERANVASQADWFVRDYQQLLDNIRKHKVAMIGSGAWACAAMHMLSANCAADDPADEFEDKVAMYVYEEEFEGRKLTEVINSTHENPKYLPGVSLGANVVAVPDLLQAVSGADVLVFCTPHQFTHNICKQLAGKIKPGAQAISLIKGMRVRPEGPQLISQMVRKHLGVECCVMMGANIAADIGHEQLSEAVIGYNTPEAGELFRKLFQRPYFKVNLLNDVVGPEMCGTLKNIVALGAGMVDGLGLGPNTKAAILRQGLSEMRSFIKALYPSVRDETFFECCGISDLIATCYGGRNRLVAMEWTKAWKAGQPQMFEQLEQELLNGQKLQGVLTSNELQEVLKARRWQLEYPLFTTINMAINGRLDPTWVPRYQEAVQHVLAPETDTDDDLFVAEPKRRGGAAAGAQGRAAAPRK